MDGCTIAGRIVCVESFITTLLRCVAHKSAAFTEGPAKPGSRNESPWSSLREVAVYPSLLAVDLAYLDGSADAFLPRGLDGADFQLGA